MRPELRFSSGIDDLLPAECAPELLMITRELLTNCVKHSGASRVSVSLDLKPEHLVLTVTDDGVGFRPDTPRIGRGLDNVRERARALGADLDIRSAPGEGTAIRVAAPLRDVPETSPSA